MAKIITLADARNDIHEGLARSFQSGNINFLLGAGASMPAIPAAGRIEQDIAALLESGDEAQAHARMYEFLIGLQTPTNALITDEVPGELRQALEQYENFIGIVEVILSERRTTLLPKQATIFTTNYDLFMEKASVHHPSLRLNDGFTRVPSLDNRMQYSSRNFFNTTYNTGNLYNYKVEIPYLNLIKLHGSLSWKKDGDDIVFSVLVRDPLPDSRTPDEITAFIADYAVVLPQTTKFRTTLTERTYYELLRIYANELDRENTLLVTFGFSFGDEHIRDITRRALKNPTLRLIAFAYSDKDRASFEKVFDGHNNVLVVAPEDAEPSIGFDRFNDTLRELLPSAPERL